MRHLLSIAVVALLATPAGAQPWYARGDFTTTPWDASVQMVDQSGGHYTASVSGLFLNQAYEYKIATADWSTSYPGSNGKVTSDANGEINFHLWDNATPDGWYPQNVRRVGYTDSQQFDWEMVGSFNGWPGTGDTNYYLMDMGNGLHHGQFTFNTGIYDFKFRKQGDNLATGTSIGSDFGNQAGRNSFRVWTNGELWNFDLDLPNGRWRAYTNAPSADRDKNDRVDARDYVLWRENDNSQAGYDVWRANFGINPWYARGTFNDWGYSNQLVPQGGGHYTATVTGLTNGTDYEYKIATPSYVEQSPTSNGKVRANANGEIKFHFYELDAPSWTDGWSPSNQSRVGYDDHNQFDWEVIGSFNNWRGRAPTDPASYLVDQGNGLHTGTFTFATAGMYQFKFRQKDSWDTSIGDNFGNAAGNNEFTVINPGDMWTFELDLPNGRWRRYQAAVLAAGAAVPEPASLLVALLGVVMVAGCSRRRCG